MSRIYRNRFLFLLLLIPAVLVIIWFRNGLIHGGGEEGVLFYNPQKTFQLSTSVWAEFTTGNLIIMWLPKSPVIYISTIFEKIGLQPFLFQAILSYILLAGGVLSVYYLTLNLLENIKDKKLISLISAVFYLFNPFTFSQIWGRSLSTQYFAFSLLPLTLLLFCLGMKRKNYVFGLLIALISVIMATAYEFLTYIIVYWLLLLIYLIYCVIISRDRKREAFFGVKFITFTSFLWCLFNFWWFIPLFSSLGNFNSAGIPNLEDNLGTLFGVSRNFTPEVIIRLLQKGYFFDSTAFSQIYSTIPFQFISFIPVIFLLVGFIKILRNQEFIHFKFFIVLLILGLFVSLGANPPLGWLFVWIFEHVTPLQAFRNPYEKFGLVFVLGYCPVFAYGLVSFLERKKYKKFLLALVLLLTCVVYAWPMWTGRVIAGYDNKIGLDIPAYYKNLRYWLKDQGGDYRLLMTPIWGGDSAFYQWNNAARYQGSDPMVFMLDQKIISNSPHGPFYFDFITYVRKNMQRENVVPALSLMRTKYLVDRKDAIMITDKEKDHIKYLTSSIYPPQSLESNLKAVCQNLTANSQLNGAAWLICQLPAEDNDLSNIRYLHLRVKTDVSANLEIALRDTKEIRIRWDGRADSSYSTKTGNWENITIPLSTPTEYNNQIDFSRIYLLEVLAHPKDSPLLSVGKIDVSGFKLDTGIERKINEFTKATQFGKLEVYEPVNFNSPPEFGSLSSIEKVGGFTQLIEETNKKRDRIDKLGFVLVSQNKQKNLESLPNEASLQVINKYKISDTRYWVKVNKLSDSGLLLLSKTFHPGWQVVTGITKEKLSGNFFDDLNLLKAAVVPENKHFVVNGYANLWKIDGKNSEYAIIFMPQIIADISFKISRFVILSALGLLIILTVNKYFKRLNHQKSICS